MGFSALQRAEIAEISTPLNSESEIPSVSVLFNEPKLLKSCQARRRTGAGAGFSALQRAEIAEIPRDVVQDHTVERFQCSSTSRNC